MHKYQISQIVKDILLSVVAYALPAIVLTFIIQPMMANKIDGESYGLFLTLISVIRLSVSILISSLANIRILRDEEYNKKKISGDFNIILIASSIIGSIVIALMSYYYNNNESLISIVLSMIVLVLLMLHDYFSVYYRVKLKFMQVVIDNIIIVVGYVLGFLLFTVTYMWQFVFIPAYASGLIYVFLTTDYWKEPLKRTALYKSTIKQHTQLASSAVIADSINYFDKILIYPTLGGNSVSVYNAAAVIGKVVQLISVPLQRVLLSYIVKINNIKKRDAFVFLLGLFVSFGVLYVILYFMSRFLIPLMYPAYYEAAKSIIWIVLLAINIDTMAGVINIIIMKYEKKSVQILISVMRMLFYLSVSLLCVPSLDLLGFCIGALAAACVRLLFVMYYYIRLIRTMAM